MNNIRLCKNCGLPYCSECAETEFWEGYCSDQCAREDSTHDKR